MSKLLPCPFCGGEAKIINTNISFGVCESIFVTCEKCGIETKRNYKTEKDAINDWNTRKQMEKIKEKLKINSQDIALIYSTDDGIDYTEDVGLSIEKAIEIVEKGGME